LAFPLGEAPAPVAGTRGRRHGETVGTAVHALVSAADGTGGPDDVGRVVADVVEAAA